jgi:hypothetical protein
MNNISWTIYEQTSTSNHDVRPQFVLFTSYSSLLRGWVMVFLLGSILEFVLEVCGLQFGRYVGVKILFRWILF